MPTRYVFQFDAQPGACESPLGFDGRETDAHVPGDLGIREAPEKTQFHDPGLARTVALQPFEAFVNGEKLHGVLLGKRNHRIERHAP